MKRTIKMLSQAASLVATIVSILAICAVLCTVSIERITLTPFLVLIAAEAWLVYVYMKHEKGGDK